MASSIINLTKGVWTKIDPLTAPIVQITHISGRGVIHYTENSVQPTHPYAISNHSHRYQSVYFMSMTAGEFIWVISEDNDATITLTM